METKNDPRDDVRRLRRRNVRRIGVGFIKRNEIGDELKQQGKEL